MSNNLNFFPNDIFLKIFECKPHRSIIEKLIMIFQVLKKTFCGIFQN
jgi:hypothetical protein